MAAASKQFNVLIQTGKAQSSKTIDITQVQGVKSLPVIVKAQADARYQFQDVSKNGQAPDTIKLKRVGKNLLVTFGDAPGTDLIIEDYYAVFTEGQSNLYGLAQDGSMYQYITVDTTNQVAALNLKDGATPVVQALGGSPVEAGFELSGLPLVAAPSLLQGLAVAGASVAGIAAVTATDNSAATALNKISAYAATGADAPTASDYAIINVSGVSSANIDAINSAIKAQKGADATDGNADDSASADSTAEVQAIVDAYNVILGEANGAAADATPGVNPTASQYQAIGANIGLAATDAENLALLNSIVGAQTGAGVGSVANINELARIANAIQLVAAGGTPNPTLTPEDFAKAGITGVTQENLSAVIANIASKADDGSQTGSLSELQGAVSAGNSALAKIEAYNNGNGTTPSALTVDDYAAAGITGVTAENLAAVNAKVLASDKGGADTVAEVQALVGKANDALAKIEAYNNGNGTTPSALTVDDYAAAGITGVTAENLAAVNAAVLAAAEGGANSVAEVQALVTAGNNALAKIENYNNGTGTNPAALTVEEYAAAGITGVTAENLAAVNAAVLAAAEGGANSVAEVQALVDTAAAAQDAARLAISAAAQGNTANGTTDAAAVTVAQYAALGVKGVDDTNLAAINSALNSEKVKGENADSTAEVQAIVDAYKAILANANNANATNPTQEQYAAIGVTGVNNAATSSLLGDAIDGKDAADVDTVDELQALANAAAAVTGASAPGATAPTAEQLALLGLKGVSPQNLAAIQAAIANGGTNGSGVTSLASLQSLIDNANDTPVVASAITSAANEAEASYTVDLLSGATDADTGETATLSLQSVKYAVDGGTASDMEPAGLSLGTDGKTLTVDPTNAVFNSLAVGQSQVILVSYQVKDVHGATVSQTATITITGTNDAPEVSATDVTGAVTELATAAGNLTDTGEITFTDVDLTDTHSVAAVAQGTTLGTLSVVQNTDTTGSGTGGKLTWSYSVAASAVEYLAKNETKVEKFDVTVSDGKGGSVVRTVEVTITGTNDAPEVSATDVTGAVTELATAAGSLTDTGAITFSDVDLTDTHSVAAVAQGTTLGTLSVVQNTDTTGSGTGGQLTWSYSVAASAVEYLAKNETKVEKFDVTVSDGKGGSVVRTVEVTITGTNDAPVLATTSTLAYTENQAAQAINSLITVSDVDNATLTFATVKISSGYVSTEDVLSFNNNATTMGNIMGSLSGDTMMLTSAGSTATQAQWQAALRAVAYNNTSNAPTTAARTVSYVINDGTANSATAVTSTINVTSVNDAPEVLASSSVSQAYTLLALPEVTITDNQSAVTVGASTEVIFTLKFNQAITDMSLTIGDLALTTGTFVANSLTKVDATTWTVKATAPASGVGTMALSIADGVYTSATGVAGLGSSVTQMYGDTTTNLAAFETTSGVSGYYNGSSTTGIANVDTSTGDTDNEFKVFSGQYSGGRYDMPTLLTASGTRLASFSSSFKFFQNSGGANNNGDGFAFSFGSASSLNTTTGSVASYPSRNYEDGYQIGLVVKFTHATSGNSGVSIRWNNSELVYSSTNGPAVGSAHTVVVDVTSTGFVTVKEGTTTIVSAQITGTQWADANMSGWQFGVSGRTGQNAGNMWIDDLAIKQPVIVAANGTSAAETFVGTDGNETNNITAGGADKVYSGAGDDTVVFSNQSAVDGMTVDGGSGVNFLQFSGATATTLDLTDAAVRARVKNFSSIDMTGSANNTLKLSYTAVSTLSGASDNAGTSTADESKMLVVSGNASDAVQLVNLSFWTVGTSQTDTALTTTYGSSYKFLSGHTYKSYTSNGATLFIDDALTVTNLAASTTAPATVYSEAVTIGSLFNSFFSDADGSSVAAGQFKGVAISNAGGGSSPGYYQLWNGTTWIDVSLGMTTASAMYADKDALIRYASASERSVVKQGLTVSLVDNSSSSTINTGETLPITTRGGTTAFSTNLVTMTATPVVIDINHDGVLTYGSVAMDVDGDGHLDQTAWAGAQDGVLVWDKLGDAKVHDNSQYAFSQYGAAGSTDLQGLAAGFDTNHDGVFNAADAKFAQFSVWQDANQNGVSDAGEMRSLADVGIASINLTSDGVVRTPAEGVTEAGQTTATATDGSSVLVSDAGFAYSSLAYSADTVAGLGAHIDLLGSNMHLDLSSIVALHSNVAAVDLTGTGANSLKLNLSDVLGTASTNGMHKLTLTGDANDTIDLNMNEWSNTGNTVTEGEHTYAVYNANASAAAQLLIDQHMVLASHG